MRRHSFACLSASVLLAASSGLDRWACIVSGRLSRGREELETSRRPAPKRALAIAHRARLKERLRRHVAASLRQDSAVKGTARHHCGQRSAPTRLVAAASESALTDALMQPRGAAESRRARVVLRPPGRHANRCGRRTAQIEPMPLRGARSPPREVPPRESKRPREPSNSPVPPRAAAR